MKNKIDKYIIANSSKIFLEGSSFEISEMILSILDTENKLDIQTTRQILKCYELINEKLKEGKKKIYTNLDVKLCELESQINKLTNLFDIEAVIQEVTDIVINNNLVVYNNMLAANISCYSITVKAAERWELEKIEDQLCNKAYNLLVALEYRNMQLGKYKLNRKCLYDLMSNLIKYDKLINRKNTMYEPKLPFRLYDKLRDIIISPMGFNLNRLWNSCARDGVYYMSIAMCEGKSARCFTRGYNIFLNALLKKDVRKKVKKK